MAARLTKKTTDNALAYYSDSLLSLKRVDGRFRRKQETRLRSKLKRLWARQIKWIIREMEDLPQFEQQEERSVVHISKKRFESEITDLIHDMPLNDDIVGAVGISARSSFVKGGRKTFKDFALGSLGISFNIVNDAAITYLNSLTTLHLSDNKGSITATTNKRIIKILADSAEKGLSYTDTSKLIQAQAKAGVFSQARGEMIAVREVGLAYGQGNLVPVERYAKEVGAIMEKIWITTADDRVTPECNDNEAQGWMPLTQNFPHTGAQIVAPRSDHPRCRCDTGYREVDLNGEPV